MIASEIAFFNCAIAPEIASVASGDGLRWHPESKRRFTLSEVTGGVSPEPRFTPGSFFLYPL